MSSKVPTAKDISNQEKKDQREAWYKIAVKVIHWKQLPKKDDDAKVKMDKISPEEWKTYFEKMLSINATFGKEKTLTKLKETEEAIKEHKGFK